MQPIRIFESTPLGKALTIGFPTYSIFEGSIMQFIGMTLNARGVTDIMSHEFYVMRLKLYFFHIHTDGKI